MLPQVVCRMAGRRLSFISIYLLLSLPVMAQIGGIDPDPGDRGTGGRGTINGNIYFPSGRRVDKRITVRLQTAMRGEMTTISDDNGAFSFRHLASGSYSVFINGDQDYEPVTEHVDIRQPETTLTLQIRLRLKPATITPPAVVGAEIESVPDAALELYRDALRQEQQGDSKSAIAQLRKAISICPQFMLAFNELGAQYLRLGDFAKAQTAIESALKLDANAFAPLLNHGIVLVFTNHYKEAEPDLRAAVAKNDLSAPAHYFLGRALTYLRRFAEAESQLLRALALDADAVPEAHRYLGAIYNSRGDNARAISELEEYVRRIPQAKDADQIRKIIQQLKQTPSAASEAKQK